jgi:beta-lactamase regulating signal transducer with metallopeptidase domain
MMAGIIDTAVSLAAQHLWQGALLAGVALAIVKLRALGPEARAWLLLAALVLAAVAPLATLLPGSTVATERITAAPRDVADAPAATSRSAPTQPATQDRGTSYLVIPKRLPSLAVLAWLLGTIWQAMRLSDGWIQARRLRRSARPEPALVSATEDLLPRGTSIAVTAVDGPLVAGLLRPCILMPRVLAESLDTAALRGVVLHEVAHVRRGDLWLGLVQRVVLAVFWWSPFLRLIAARLDVAREMACDARAAKGCGGNVNFATALLTSVETLVAFDRPQSLLATAMSEDRSHLEVRIDGLLGDDAPAGRRRVVASSLCIAALVAFAGLAVAATPRTSVAISGSAVELGVQDATPRTSVTTSGAAVEPGAHGAALIAAVGAGDIDAVRRLVDDHADVNARVRGHGTPLIRAIFKHDLPMIDALLELGADPNRGAPGEGTPMILAASLGYQSIVEQLVEAGGNVSFVDRTYAQTPLIMAAHAGHLMTVKYLVAHGADVNQGVVADWEQRWLSPLGEASDPAVRDYLISQGAIAERK